MFNINLPSILNLPEQNLSNINLPPIQIKILSSKELFHCIRCPKKFNTKNSLIRHTRSHTGNKPYLCENCNKRFSRKDILVRHKESLKCIQNTLAANRLKSENESSRYLSPMPSPSILQSRISISSLVLDTSSLKSEEDEPLKSACNNGFPLHSLQLPSNQLVIRSQQIKSYSNSSPLNWNY